MREEIGGREKVWARSDLRASRYVYHTASIARDHEEDEGTVLLSPIPAPNRREYVSLFLPLSSHLVLVALSLSILVW